MTAGLKITAEWERDISEGLSRGVEGRKGVGHKLIVTEADRLRSRLVVECYRALKGRGRDGQKTQSVLGGRTFASDDGGEHGKSVIDWFSSS